MQPAHLPISRPAHAEVFARLEQKGDSIATGQPAGFRRMFGVQICDMAWTDALTYVELIFNMRQSARALSFLDRQTMLRLAIDADCRAVLSNRILLPASRALDVSARWQGGGALKTRFDAARFVDSLLTFMPRCHIALVGAGVSRLEAMREHLSQHAPWHMFSITRAADIGNGIATHSAVAGFVGAVPDVVIVDACGFDEETRYEKAVSLRHNGLIIMAGAAFNSLNP